jgi:ribosomal protein S27E
LYPPAIVSDPFFGQEKEKAARKRRLASIATHYLTKEVTMSNQHCPGFESNKTLQEIKVKCPKCGQEKELFSDELNKQVTCSGCGATYDPAANKVA